MTRVGGPEQPLHGPAETNVDVAAALKAIGDSAQQLKEASDTLRQVRLGDAGAGTGHGVAPNPSCPQLPSPSAPPPPCPSPAAPVVAKPPPPAVRDQTTVDTPLRGIYNRWLVIGVPSVPRSSGIDYLVPTLDFLLDQIPDEPSHPLWGKVLVVVMNNAHGKPHKAFEDAQVAFSKQHSRKGAEHIHFLTNEVPALTGNVRGTANMPGTRVQQQTMDVVALLRAVGELSPKHYMFMEDDFRLCPHALRALEYLVDKAYSLEKDWLLLRVCFGLNGALVKGTDVAEMARYLEKHSKRRPPDHLMVEWYAAETEESRGYVGNRAHITFRYNLLEHFGTVSSLRSQRHGEFSACYDTLDAGALFEVEAFKEKECGHDDVQPCRPADTPLGHGIRNAPPPPFEFGHLKERVKRVDQNALHQRYDVHG